MLSTFSPQCACGAYARLRLHVVTCHYKEYGYYCPCCGASNGVDPSEHEARQMFIKYNGSAWEKENAFSHLTLHL